MTALEILIFLTCIALAAALIVTRYKIKLELPAGKSEEKSSDDPHHAPAAAHHSGGGDHSHAHGHKKDWVQTILGWLIGIGLVVLVVLAVIWMHERSVREIQNNTTYSVGRAAAAHAAAIRGSMPVSSDWQRIVLPQADADWSPWVQIPVGYTIRFCDPVSDQSCSAKDFSAARFDLQCRSLADGTALDQESGQCTWTDAHRMRAKGMDAMTLLYRFEPQE